MNLDNPRAHAIHDDGTFERIFEATREQREELLNAWLDYAAAFRDACECETGDRWGYEVPGAETWERMRREMEI